ncbi:MAG: MFS transporter [Silvanigrellaceae bacterium]|nr:MFS transporter [Silvanigrellaceae bacterium]
MNTSVWISLPLLPILSKNTLHATPPQIATIISIYVIFSRFLLPIGGVFVTYKGVKLAIILGSFMRICAYLLYGFTESFYSWCFASCLWGIGGALFFDPAVYTIFGSTPSENKRRPFIMVNQALNIGVLVGAFLGGMFVKSSNLAPFIASTVLVSLCSLIAFFKVTPKYDVVEKNKAESMIKLLGMCLKNKNLRLIMIILVLVNIVLIQISVGFPLLFTKSGFSSSDLSLSMIAKGAISILMIAFAYKIFEKFPPILLIGIGVVLAAIGMNVPILNPNLITLILGLIVFTIGETLILPASDIFINEKTGKNEVIALRFSLAQFAIGIGAFLGSFVGSYYFERSLYESYQYLFIIIALFPLFLCLNTFKR